MKLNGKVKNKRGFIFIHIGIELSIFFKRFKYFFTIRQISKNVFRVATNFRRIQKKKTFRQHVKVLGSSSPREFQRGTYFSRKISTMQHHSFFLLLSIYRLNARVPDSLILATRAATDDNSILLLGTSSRTCEVMKNNKR